jgi:hypothetical protein
MNCALAYTPTWIDRLRWKLFPLDTCDIPDIPAKDCVITRTEVRFSLLGRLRVLFSGRIEVETKTATENIVGATATASCRNIKAPLFLDRHKTRNVEADA